jgi:DeoR/GlpR family transcriptional regulator of sugar metabolism
MKLDDRRQQIVELLMEAGSVTLEELAQRFNVSKMTIHRDLDDLESAGMLRKVRGGASIETSIQFESDYRYRERRDAEEKRCIARAAADLIEPGMTVLINDGTTAGLLAELLPEKRPLTVITNNMAAIGALWNANGINLLALGGNYSRKFNGFFGLVTEESLMRLRADVSFISAPAVSGMACFHMDHEVVRTKRLMISCGARSYLLVDHQKFGRTALHHLANLTEFEAIITGAALERSISAPLVDAGIRLISVGEERTHEQ